MYLYECTKMIPKLLFNKFYKSSTATSIFIFDIYF